MASRAVAIGGKPGGKGLGGADEDGPGEFGGGTKLATSAEEKRMPWRKQEAEVEKKKQVANDPLGWLDSGTLGNMFAKLIWRSPSPTEKLTIATVEGANESKKSKLVFISHAFGSTLAIGSVAGEPHNMKQKKKVVLEASTNLITWSQKYVELKIPDVVNFQRRLTCLQWRPTVIRKIMAENGECTDQSTSEPTEE